MDGGLQIIHCKRRWQGSNRGSKNSRTHSKVNVQSDALECSIYVGTE
jgi:hypothetical protein